MEINLYICFVRVWKIGFEAKERALTLSHQTVGTKMYNRSSQTVLTDGSIDRWIDLDPQTPTKREKEDFKESLEYVGKGLLMLKLVE